MPTVLTHPAIPIALGTALGRSISRRLIWAGVIASVIPDLDVIGFRLGISYSDALGHRGATHSLVFAAGLGFLGMAAHRELESPPWISFFFVAASAASHGLIDMLTNGGLGVALFWPFSGERYFFPVQVIEVSPLSIRRVFSEAGLRVFGSELLWVWLPALTIALVLSVARRRRAL